ncbi:ubiquitin-protein ligase E3A-like [Ornithodoros turicata]
MNPGEQGQASDGPEATRKLAVKALIERYYYQLTDGCGMPNCTNENCASSRRLQPLSPNEAAARAIQLFITKAQLCERKTTSSSSGVSNHVLNHSQGVGAMLDNGEPKPMQVSEATCSSSGGENRRSNLLSTDHTEKASKVTNECPMVTKDSLMCLIEECRKTTNYTPLIHTLGQVYSREDCLKRSFPRQQSVTKEDLRAMEVDMDKDEDCQELHSAAAAIGGTASPPCPRSNTSQEITVDVDAVRETYGALFSIPDHPFSDALVNAILILCETLEISLKYHNSYQNDPSLLNIFVVLMELPLLEGPFCGGALQAICRACDLLPIEAHCRLAHHWARHSSPRHFRNMVNALHHVITTRVIEGHFGRELGVSEDSVIVLATKMMKILFMANMLGGDLEKTELCSEDSARNRQDTAGRKGIVEVVPAVKEDPLCEKLGIRVIDCRKPIIPFEEFYNEPLSEQLETDRGFAHGRAKDGPFSFLNHAFVLTPAVKALGLYYDNRIRMYNERSLSMFQMLVGNPANPYLRLNVRRDHIIDDALYRLEMLALEDPSSLKKQLVVEFEGEQGIDEGGVSKEFFQLVVEEVFNPDFAMFTLNNETQTYWFNPTSFESDAQFKLIGIILGLAIYNNIILDVHFPMVVYYKLLGKRGTYRDLSDWNPSLAQGLDQLLAYEGDNIEDVFMQTFRITYQDVFGSVLTHDLKEDGDKILVNQQNKREFVDAYADFLLNKSIEKQFSAFRRGFLLVTDDSPLQILFRPEEVELLVCGSKNFDFNALEESTEYDGGYMASTPIIRHFWELVHEFSIEQKRKLLQFATGSDRVPVGGLSKLRLVIARHGPDSDRLPTAHTCFNVLLLPEYSSKEKLQERLLKAICYSKGFGMF